MEDTQNKNQYICPECDTPIILPENLMVGTVIECSACATESECVNLQPLTFVPLEQEK
jgi:hypothetical protein